MAYKNKIRMRAAAAGCALFFIFALPIGAFAKELIPMGRTVGIEMSTDGVLVAGISKVETAAGEASPAGDAGIMPGDIIVKLGADSVRSAEDFMAAAGRFTGEPIAVTLKRSDKLIQYTVTPALITDGTLKLGLRLRDGITGIGTVTYYDPETGFYAALGHSINDVDTGVVLPLGDGFITKASVADVQKGIEGVPGELHGCFDTERRLGSILGNTACGIFGKMDEAPAGAALESASSDEIQTGAATILAQVSGSQTQAFDVEISRVYRGGEERLMVRVTDPELLELTGGIVQGMSGCPILQNGKLIGAVTHVLLSDPTRGYGVTIDAMLNAANDYISSKAAA